MTENTTPDEVSTTDPIEPTGNREAAMRRKQLREAEAERDTLRDQLTAARSSMLRAAVAGYQVAGATFNEAAFDDAGIDVDAAFTDDGTIDAETLEQTMRQLAADKPFMFTAPQRMVIPSEGRSPENQTIGNQWHDAFKPSRA